MGESFKDEQHLQNKESWNECGDIPKGVYVNGKLKVGCIIYLELYIAFGSLFSGWTVQLSDQSGGPGRSCAMVANLTPHLWELPTERD